MQRRLNCVVYLALASFLCFISTCYAFSAQLARPREYLSKSYGRHRSKRGRILRRIVPFADDVLIILLGSENDENALENKIDGDKIESSNSFDPANGSSIVPPADPENNDSTNDSLWEKRGVLFQMTRPTSIPGILMFHMLGIFLTLRETGQSHLYWKTLTRPVVWMTLLSVNFVSATSMLVNDYYDAKLGRDAMKRKEKIILHFENGVSLNLVRELLMYMYASALLVASFLPGIPTRLAVNWALIMTYLYTKHLKPMTWIKNIVCASVISLAPWTAGSSVFHLLQNTDATMGIFFVPSLWRLFTVLFAGILGREILMDCNDVEADEAAGIRTVPVVYGRQKASRIATFSAVAMLLISSTPHIYQLMAEGLAVVPLRRLILSSIGCGAQVWGSLRVWKNKGKDPALVDKVVNGSLLTVVFLLASFM